jgi:heterodisulfide reductase subunit B
MGVRGMSETRYAIFLGCTVPVRSFQYELSARNVLKALGVELVDIQDFACCGFPVEGVDHFSASVLAARNLALAEKEGLNIMTLCSACTGHLAKTLMHLSGEGGKEELARVNEVLKDFDLEYKGRTRVKHFARVLIDDVGLEAIRAKVVKPLDALRIAPHYGCHYVKPSEIFDGYDDPVHPRSLDELIEVTGAEAVDYRDKMACCGGGILAIEEETPMKMVQGKLENIKKAGADAMTLICPFCNIMYDEFQPTIETNYETEYNIPSLFYSQLLGLAMGMDPKKELGVKKNVVKVKPLLKKLGGEEEARA